MKSRIKKILIANRSEIATRIQVTCQKMGIDTVILYAPEDKSLKFVHMATKSIALPLSGTQAYLDQDQIIKIAQEEKVDAIIPGYGFLSEDHQFAQRIISNNIIWVGPSPQIMQIAGNKILAKKLVSKLGIPTIPYRVISISKLDRALNIAQQIGFPVLLKDPTNGGGKGMRMAKDKEDFKQQWNSLTTEIRHKKIKYLLML